VIRLLPEYRGEREKEREKFVDKRCWFSERTENFMLVFVRENHIPVHSESEGEGKTSLFLNHQS